MPDFTAGGIHALPIVSRSTGNAEFDRRIRELVADWGCTQTRPLIQELIVTALKIGRDNLSVADLKLFNRSLKEMRHAAKTFASYTHSKKVVVFGSARTEPDHPAALAAQDFGAKMSEAGFMTITGGGEGIMGAAQRGAGREQSFGLNIRLPFEQRPNETIEGDPKLITFNYFFTRKLNFVKETHAVALFPGGFGTMDEGFEVLTLMQTGKARILPVVFVDEPGGTYWNTWVHFLHEHLLGSGLVSEEDFNFFKITDSVDRAVEEILHFYRNFHSYRWVGKTLVIRLLRPLSTEALRDLNEEFAELVLDAPILQGAALPEEGNEPELHHLPRIFFQPRIYNFGRFRQLIDAVNEAALA
jgi:uncharacterized protein (TIGR00730 family)